MPVKPIPDGYHSITPYMIMRDATRALDFYKRAFNAEEMFRMDAPGGKIGHAEIRIGDSVIMLADEAPDKAIVGPQSLGGTTISLMIYVNDVDKVFAQAVAAGAKVERPVANQFYGDRSGMLNDPFGHRWAIATHVEDLSKEEIEKRIAALGQK